MDNVIHSSKHFRLIKWRHRKSDKVHYRVEMSYDYWMDRNREEGEKSFPERVRDVIDPTRCRSGQGGDHWKYRNLEEATKAYTFLVMKFS
jgi:hypothetical protein